MLDLLKTCNIPQIESDGGLSWPWKVFCAVVHPQSGHHLYHCHDIIVSYQVFTFHCVPSFVSLLLEIGGEVVYLLAKLFSCQLVDEGGLSNPSIAHHNHLAIDK